MSARSNDMRVAILYAPGDDALAEQVRADVGFGDALLVPLAPNIAFGPQLRLMVLWTGRARGHEALVQHLAETHPSLILWRKDDAPSPSLSQRIVVLKPDSTAAAIAPALRLMEIDSARPREQPVARRRVTRGVTAAVLGIGIAAAVGAAGAAAMMLDGEAPLQVFAGPSVPEATPSPDLRPTSQP